MADEPVVPVEAPIQPAPSKRPVSHLPQTTNPIEGAEDKGWDALMAKMGKDLKVNMFNKPTDKPVAEGTKNDDEKEKKGTPAPAAGGDSPPAKKEGDQPPAPAPAKKEVKVSKRSPAPPIDPTKIATDAATQAAAAVVKEMKAAPASPAPEPPLEVPVSEEDKPVIEVLEFMAKKDKGNEPVLRKYNEFLKKERDYRSKWESENAGKSFDPDSDDHSAFYEANAVPLNEGTFRRAEQQMIAERATEEATKKVREEYNGKLSALERERILERIQPEVNHRGALINKEIATALGEGVLKSLETAEGFSKLREDDPVAAEAFEKAHKEIAPVVEAVITVYNSRGLVPIDVKNPAHLRIGEIVGNLEEAIAKQPIEDQMDEKGRRFASTADYVKMTPEQQSKHWIVGRDEILLTLQETGKSIAKTHQQERMALIAKYGGKATTQKPDGGTAKKDEKPPDPPKPKSVPSIAAGAKIGTNGGGATPEPEKFSKGIGMAMFGR